MYVTTDYIATRYTLAFHVRLVEFTLLNFRKNNFFLSFYVSVGKLHLDFRSIFQTVETRHHSTVSPFQNKIIPCEWSEFLVILKKYFHDFNSIKKFSNIWGSAVKGA